MSCWRVLYFCNFRF